MQNNNSRRPRKNRRFRTAKGRVNASKTVTKSELMQLGVYCPPIPRSLFVGEPVPPFTIKNLVFIDPAYVIQGASSFLITEFSMNGAFDPIPALGGGSPSGFTFWSGAYGSYHVIGFRISYQITCNESGVNGISENLIFRDFQPSTAITTYALARDAMEVSPCTRPTILSVSTGMGRAVHKEVRVHPGSVIGNPLSYMSDISYTAAVTANPAQQAWCAHILCAPTSGTNLTNGAIAVFRITYTVRFYSTYTSLGRNGQVERKYQDFPVRQDPVLVTVQPPPQRREANPIGPAHQQRYVGDLRY